MDQFSFASSRPGAGFLFVTGKLRTIILALPGIPGNLHCIQ